MIDKTKVFEALKADYADNPLVSERTIKETLENLTAIVKDDIEEDKFLEYAKSQLKTTEGQARKSSSDAVKKVEAEKKPTPEPDKPKKETSPEDKKDEKPTWLDELMSEIGGIKQKLAEEDKRKTAEQVRESSLAKAKIYPQNVIDVAADGFDFGQENAETAFIEKVGRTAAKFGVVPEKGNAEPQKPDFSAFTERLKERGLIPETKN